jgi:hypothetical protein
MMLTLWITWCVLTIAVITLAILRKVSARHEDSYVHLADSEAQIITEQASVAGKLDRIDYWGKALTVVDLAFLAVLLGIVLFNAWRSSLQTI